MATKDANKRRIQSGGKHAARPDQKQVTPSRTPTKAGSAGSNGWRRSRFTATSSEATAEPSPAASSSAQSIQSEPRKERRSSGRHVDNSKDLSEDRPLPKGADYGFVVTDGLLGIRLTNGPGPTSVTQVIDNSIASTKGVALGDVLVYVNDTTVEGVAPKELTDILRQRPVHLWLKRGGMNGQSEKEQKQKAYATNRGSLLDDSRDSFFSANSEDIVDQAVSVTPQDSHSKPVRKSSFRSSFLSDTSSSCGEDDIKADESSGKGERAGAEGDRSKHAVKRLLAEAMDDQDAEQLNVLIPEAIAAGIDDMEIRAAQRLVRFLESKGKLRVVKSDAALTSKGALADAHEAEEVRALRAALSAQESRCMQMETSLQEERRFRLEFEEGRESAMRDSRHLAYETVAEETRGNILLAETRAKALSEENEDLRREMKSQQSKWELRDEERQIAFAKNEDALQELTYLRDISCQRSEEVAAQQNALDAVKADVARKRATIRSFEENEEVATKEVQSLRHLINCEREDRESLEMQFKFKLQTLADLVNGDGVSNVAIGEAVQTAAEGISRVAEVLQDSVNQNTLKASLVGEAVQELQAISQMLVAHLNHEVALDTATSPTSTVIEQSPRLHSPGSGNGDSDHFNFSPAAITHMEIANNAKMLKMEDLVFGDRLGQGAVGQVWMGTVASSGQAVAIKQFIQGAFEDFRLEVQCLGRLSHPNIVELVGAVVGEEDHLVVLEFLRAPNWQALSSKSRAMRDILTGLAYCHAEKVVHLDIKLDNLMEDPKTGAIKLIDFSVGRDCTEPFTCFYGSLPFAAPELCLPAPWQGPPADVFSAGVVLAFLLDVQALFKHLGWAVELNDESDEGRARQVPELQRAAVRLVQEIGQSSNSGGDLCRNLLEVEPQRRSTAEEALRHPWLKGD